MKEEIEKAIELIINSMTDFREEAFILEGNLTHNARKGNLGGRRGRPNRLPRDCR